MARVRQHLQQLHPLVGLQPPVLAAGVPAKAQRHLPARLGGGVKRLGTPKEVWVKEKTYGTNKLGRQQLTSAQRMTRSSPILGSCERPRAAYPPTAVLLYSSIW